MLRRATRERRLAEDALRAAAGNLALSRDQTALDTWAQRRLDGGRDTGRHRKGVAPLVPPSPRDGLFGPGGAAGHPPSDAAVARTALAGVVPRVYVYDLPPVYNVRLLAQLTRPQVCCHP